MHSVKLEPLHSMPVATNFARKKSSAAPHLGFNGKDSNRKSSDYATFSADGKEICRNFNSTNGCHLDDCRYQHVCNRVTKW